MGYEHFFTAPDGTELAVITRAELEQLRAGELDEDAADILAADRARAESHAVYPAEVVDAMLAGDTPIAAWRKYHKLSQAALAQRCGLTQAGISRLEKSEGEHPHPQGRIATRKAIARALEIPASFLEPLAD